MLPQWLRKRITGNILWEFPDLGAVTLAVFVVFLGIGTILPVLTIYAQERGITTADIGIATSAWMLVNFLFQMPMGWLSDRIGRKPLMLFGLALHIVITIAYLGLDNAPMLIVLRFFDGLGGAAVWPAARAHVMDHAPAERRGQALGMMGAAINGGIMIGPAIGGFLGGVSGFSGPFWFGAITGLLSLLFLAWKVKDTRRAPKVDEAVVVTADSAATPERERRVKWGAVLPVFLMAAGWGVAGSFFNVIWNIWMHDLGASLDVIGLSYTLFALPLLVVGPWAGKVADRRNRVLLVLVPTLIASSIYLSYGFLTNIPIILVLGVVEGAMLAFLTPSSDSYFADVVPARLRGRMQGVTNSVSTAVGFIAAASLGVIYGLSPTWAFIAVAAATALPVIPAALLMNPHEARLRPRGRAPQPEAAPDPAELHATAA
jgi:DHA1 family multidrug resistance protein-like MFS transporter